MKKTEVMTGILVSMILLMTSFAVAFGVSIPYMEDKKLYINPGETKDFQADLQIEPGGETTNAAARILEGSEVISLVDDVETYEVNPGVHTKVNFKIAVPSSAAIGTTYPIKLAFSTVDAGTGAFSFGSSIEQNFNVVVGEKPKPVVESTQEPLVEEKSNLYLYLIIGIIIALIVIIFLVYNNKKK